MALGVGVAEVPVQLSKSMIAVGRSGVKVMVAQVLYGPEVAWTLSGLFNGRLSTDQKPSRSLRACVDADPNVLPRSSSIVTVPLLPDGELMRPPMLPLDSDVDATVELGTGVAVALADSNANVVAAGVDVGDASGIAVVFDDTFVVEAGVILSGIGAAVGVAVGTIVSA